MKFGLIGYSPLFGGFLTGKYLGKEPSEGRFVSEKSGGWSKDILKSIYVDQIDVEKIN